MTDRRYYNLKNRMEEIVDQIESMSREQTEEGSKEMREYAQMLRERSKHAIDKAKKTGQQVNDYAHEHPWTLMGIGVAIGVLVGIALKKQK